MITRIWRKSDFRVWQLSTLVPIKMSVSSLTELHTPCKTLGFSIVSKEQPLFKSVTGLNPVFQPILTVTIVTVNMGWNTGFSPVTDLNKGCSLLTVLKLNVWRGVCSVFLFSVFLCSCGGQKQRIIQSGVKLTAARAAGRAALPPTVGQTGVSQVQA